MTITIIEDNFGQMSQPVTNSVCVVKRFTFVNSLNGIRIQIISYGATITSFVVPDKNGKFDDIVLGYDNMNGYLNASNPYFGATIGRVCNRISNAQFTLNGKTYLLAKNNNGIHLHGGIIGFDKFNWDAVVLDNQKVVMTHVNPDGFEGYPGTVVISVTFSLNQSNTLSVEFQATSSHATPINLTNHSYFNLAGHSTGANELYKHVVMLNADQITKTDENSIPSGTLQHVNGTPYDMRTPCDIGQGIFALPGVGFDDNFCIVKAKDNSEMQHVATVVHRDSGRCLEVCSDQPGVQFYTSNYMPDPDNTIYPPGKPHMSSTLNPSSGIVGKDGAIYLKHGAFCLETQNFPDAVNHENFPSSILYAGNIYKHSVNYTFNITK